MKPRAGRRRPGALRPLKAKVRWEAVARRRTGPTARWCSSRRYADAGGRGQDHDDDRPGRRALAGSAGAPSLALREPSLGPVFGMKGGGDRRRPRAGRADGRHQPALHRRHARDHRRAQPARRDASTTICYHGNPLGLDPRRILWKRVLDMNDRALRDIVHRPRRHGARRAARGAASTSPRPREVMAMLCLAARPAPISSARLEPHRRGLRRATGTPVTAARAQGAPARWRRSCSDAIMPNLVQTLEGTPAFVHGGPFAQHRARLQQPDRHPAGAAARRTRRHRGRLRLRPRRREVLRHQVPHRRALNPAAVGDRGHGARAQDARRRARSTIWARPDVAARPARDATTSPRTSRTSATIRQLARRGDQPLLGRHRRRGRRGHGRLPRLGPCAVAISAAGELAARRRRSWPRRCSRAMGSGPAKAPSFALPARRAAGRGRSRRSRPSSTAPTGCG